MLRPPCPHSPPTPTQRPSRPLAERAQASIELLGSLPVLLLGLLACMQAMLVALALVFSQSAADRAARGASRAQVVSSIPAPWRSRVRVRVTDSEAFVRIAPPVVLPGASRLRIEARSEVAT